MCAMNAERNESICSTREKKICETKKFRNDLSKKILRIAEPKVWKFRNSVLIIFRHTTFFVRGKVPRSPVFTNSFRTGRNSSSSSIMYRLHNRTSSFLSIRGLPSSGLAVQISFLQAGCPMHSLSGFCGFMIQPCRFYSVHCQNAPVTVMITSTISPHQGVAASLCRNPPGLPVHSTAIPGPGAGNAELQ